MSLPEQDTTDFEKCLYSVDAPYFLAVGFLGRRFDHSLAATHILWRRRTQRVILVSEEEIVFLLPRHWRIEVPTASRVSLFPLRPIYVERSQGLRWPLDGLQLEIGQQIGTSNESAAPTVEIILRLKETWSSLLVTLERRHLRAALVSLGLCGGAGQGGGT